VFMYVIFCTAPIIPHFLPIVKKYFSCLRSFSETNKCFVFSLVILYRNKKSRRTTFFRSPSGGYDLVFCAFFRALRTPLFFVLSAPHLLRPPRPALFRALRAPLFLAPSAPRSFLRPPAPGVSFRTLRAPLFFAPSAPRSFSRPPHPVFHTLRAPSFAPSAPHLSHPPRPIFRTLRAPSFAPSVPRLSRPPRPVFRALCAPSFAPSRASSFAPSAPAFFRALRAPLFSHLRTPSFVPFAPRLSCPSHPAFFRALRASLFHTLRAPSFAPSAPRSFAPSAPHLSHPPRHVFRTLRTPNNLLFLYLILIFRELQRGGQGGGGREIGVGSITCV
jgi:hypothetical protein